MSKRALASWLVATLTGLASALSSPAVTSAAAAEVSEVVDRAPAAGVSAMTRTYSATRVDYDRDSDQDVWIGYHAGGGKLWSNRGNGTYRWVGRLAWPTFNADDKQIDRHDCAWADVDRNGRPDAYCSTGRFIPNHVKVGRDNELWLGGRRGGFREVGSAWGVGDECGRGRQVAFLDANGDRYPDLFLGNDIPRDDPDDACNRPKNVLPNEQSKMFINTGGTGFRYDRRFWDYGSGPGSQCAETFDVNGDGWDDLLACANAGERPRVYHNRAGHGFADFTSAHQLASGVNDAVAADLDGDDDPDVITAGDTGFAYHLNTEGHLGAGQQIGLPPTGQARSVAVGDADRDGDLDVYAMVGDGQRSNPDDIVWINDQLSFTALAVPSAGGAADEVIALNPLRHRRSEFLALNGFGRAATPAGPVQLIRVTRP